MPLALTAGFLGLIAIGSLLLSLPVASASGQWTPWLVAVFTATSATCVTGLVVVDTATHWSPVGQAVILALVQVGGLGFMTAATVIFLLFGRRITLQERLAIQFSLGTAGIGGLGPLVLRLIRMVLAIEAISALLLALHFLRDHAPIEAGWRGLFLAVSAFNNAGFDLTGGFGNLMPYRRDWYVLGVLGALIVLGGISYTAIEDLWRTKSFRKATLDTELVLVVSGLLLLSGWILFFVGERTNPLSLGSLALPDQLANAAFMSVSARTAGFNAVNVGALQDHTLFAMLALMFVGGASGSTAGGIKVNTFSLLVVATLSAIVGHREVRVFKRTVPDGQVRRALAIAVLSAIVVLVVAYWLAAVENTRFIGLLLESVSAFATVGLSTGITPGLTEGSKITLIVTMFVGRLGPLTLALLLANPRPARATYAEEWVKIG